MSSRTSMEDLERLLPKPVPVTEIALGHDDVLITAPGFEDRTLALVGHLSVTENTSAILLDYRPLNPENRIQEVADGLASIGLSRQNQATLVYDRFNPDDFEDRLRTQLTSSCKGTALVDISTMSKLAIMLILKTIANVGVRVSVFYAEAEEYGPNEQEFELAKSSNEVHRPSLQIFSGIHGVVRVDSLASVAMQGQPTAAIAFMSFNDALTQTLLNTVYPARLFLVNGRPPVHSWREQATGWIHDQVRAEWRDDNPLRPDGSGLPLRSVSTLDYRETVMMLLDLYWQLSTDHRILLAPAGSKFQAVGCYIVKALHPDIHVEYPSPQGFLKVYSTGIGKCWKLELEEICGLIDRISDVERNLFLRIEGSFSNATAAPGDAR